MTMIERVARAMFAECAKQATINVCPWEGQDERDRNVWRAAARRAIEAMREPTEDEIRYVHGEMTTNLAFDASDIAYIGAFWCAVIDAALAEPIEPPVSGG